MICYRDMTFCVTRNCANIQCERNTRNKGFRPLKGEFVAYADFRLKCNDYRKDEQQNEHE